MAWRAWAWRSSMLAGSDETKTWRRSTASTTRSARSASSPMNRSVACWTISCVARGRSQSVAQPARASDSRDVRAAALIAIGRSLLGIACLSSGAGRLQVDMVPFVDRIEAQIRGRVEKDLHRTPIGPALAKCPVEVELDYDVPGEAAPGPAMPRSVAAAHELVPRCAPPPTRLGERPEGGRGQAAHALDELCQRERGRKGALTHGFRPISFRV